MTEYLDIGARIMALAVLGYAVRALLELVVTMREDRRLDHAERMAKYREGPPPMR